MTTNPKTRAKAAGAITIALSKIRTTAGLSPRQSLSPLHVEQLRQAIKRGSKMPPVLVWRAMDKDRNPTGDYVLLDGLHRLAALRKECPHLAEIEAEVFEGEPSEAMLAAAGRNAKDILPLSKRERMDAAWAVVKADPDLKLSKSRIARCCAVSPRTVASMRAMAKEWPKGEPMETRWSKAQHGWEDTQGQYEDQLTEGQRKRLIKEGAKELAKVFGRWPRKDLELCAEMMEEALGYRWQQVVGMYIHSDEDGEYPWTGLEGDHDPNRAPELDPEADF